MRRWRVGSFSMGISLIFVGVLLLLGQIKAIQSVYLILTWWPIVLIILGIEILVHIYLSKEEDPKVKYDVFSMIIISVLIVFSLGAYTVGNAVKNVPGIEFHLR